MAIKAQILTFREAFLLTEKGKAYKEKSEAEQVLEMVEVDGKWVKKVEYFEGEYEGRKYSFVIFNFGNKQK